MAMWPFSYLEKLINEHGSSNILRDRIVLMEQQHLSEKQAFQKEKDELASQLRLVTDERDFARRELQQTKNELEQTKVRVLQMEPLAIKAREMAISVGFRKAIFGSGHVLTLQNKTEKPLGVNITVADASGQKGNEFRFVVDGGRFQAVAKEIGHIQGWAFSSGDNIKIVCAGYDPITLRVP